MSSKYIDLIRDRIRRDKNLIIIVTGETGSGKSTIGIRLGEVLDPSFNINHIVFSAEAFINLLNSGKLKKGNVIVFDEAGVGIPAKEWYDISNRLFNYVLQTFRHDNLIVIFTCPTIGFIDNDSRKLLHYIIEAKNIDELVQQNITKIYTVQHNPRLNKNYYPELKIKGDKISPVRFNHPKNLDLIEEYKDKKREFTDELNKNAEALIKKNKEKKNKKPVNIRKIKTEIKRKRDFYSKTTKKGKTKFDLLLIHAHYKTQGVSRDTAYGIKKDLEAEYNV